MAKLAATEGAQRVIDAALQLWGGAGVQSGQVVERLYRDIRALRIYEGASEVQQLIIARELLKGRDSHEHPAASPPTSTPSRATTCRRSSSSRSTCSTCPSCSSRRSSTARSSCWTRRVARGWGERPCIVGPGLRWTYAELQRKADAIAHVLVDEMGVRPGQRVLLRAPNNAMLAACWFGVMKTGAVAVATMPLLRAKELKQVVAKAQVTHALCDLSLAEELQLAQPHCPTLTQVRLFNDASADGLEAAMARHARPFTAVDTAADDTCLLAFTSGTTGEPKATMHFHQDVMAICLCWPRHVLRAHADDVFIGSPPLGFTFGLGGLLLFPLSIGASTVLLEKATPPVLLDAIPQYARDRAVHRAHHLPRDRRAGARAPAVGGARRHAAQVRVGRRGAARGHARAVEGGHRHRGDRRHRLHRDAAHLHLGRRGARAARRHRHAGARLPGLHPRPRRRPAAARRRRPPRGARPHRLPLPRRPAPGAVRARRLERHRRRLPARTRTATSATRRAPTT